MYIILLVFINSLYSYYYLTCVQIHELCLFVIWIGKH